MFRIIAHAETHHRLMASHQSYIICKWQTSLAPDGEAITNPTLHEHQSSALHSSSKGPMTIQDME